MSVGVIAWTIFRISGNCGVSIIERRSGGARSIMVCLSPARMAATSARYDLVDALLVAAVWSAGVGAVSGGVTLAANFTRQPTVFSPIFSGAASSAPSTRWLVKT